MPTRVPISLAILASLLAGAAYAAGADPSARPAGRLDGAAVLPDNRVVAPAGHTLATAPLPLGIALSPDGRHLLISTDGAGPNLLQNIALPAGTVAQSVPIAGELFLGVAYSADGTQAFAAGGGSGTLYRFSVDGRGLLQPLPPLKTGGFPGGLAVLPPSGVLLSADNLGDSLRLLAPNGGSNVSVGSHPLAVVATADGRRAYVADGGSNDVSVVPISGAALGAARSVPVGSYPTALALSHDGRALYVANANADSISVIDTGSARVRRTISVRPVGAPPGSAPDALALSPDDRTLYVANGGDNDVAMVDTASGGVRGLIPAGWWPSALALSRDGRTLYVASAKGLGFFGNTGLYTGGRRDPAQYIGAGMAGSLSIVPVPDAAALAQFTAQVRSQARVATLQAAPPAGNPIPALPGGPTPFRHVIVVDKENRSYDQVFGDEPQGNGDPNLVLFGRRVTPNLHALAERFGLLDNTYANGEVSADGHQWLDGAYATTYLQQSWPERYGSLSRRPNDFGIAPISYPPSGYIFNDAAAHGVSYRAYGEELNAGGLSLLYLGHADLLFPLFNLAISDQRRMDEWLSEFDGFARNNTLPQLEYVWLPRDHTTGTLQGQNVPQAQVADNDLAVGRLVAAVSHSRYWRDTLILVIEDDAQDGPDHVDGHRTEALAISAYNRAGAVIHTHFDQLSLLRTLELVLGLPPLSQFDARALPMYDVFRTDGHPDLRPYTALPARVDLRAANPPGAPGAALSAKLDFRGPDRAPAAALNRILWRALRGPDIPYPALGAPHTIPMPIDSDR